MEEPNIGIIIGATAFVIGIFACIALLILRSGRSKSFGWFRTLVYMLVFGTGVLYLVGTLSLWDIITNGKWSEIGRPISMLVSAISLTWVMPRIFRQLNKDSLA